MPSNRIALFDMFPDLEHHLARVPLIDSPTPVRLLSRFSNALGSEIWIKDDRFSAQPYGGNKPRKLEFLLADAKNHSAHTLITTGGIGSNHCLATSLYASRIEAIPHLILFPQPITPHVRMSLRLYQQYGAVLHLGRDYSELDALRSNISLQVDRPYYIPAGGSNAIGALGFVNAGLELAQQIERHEIPRPGAVIIAAGTCGSLAGLLLGCELAGLNIPIFGVQVVDAIITNPNTVRRLIDETDDLLCALAGKPTKTMLGKESIRLLGTFFGEGYGHPTREAEAARRLMLKQEGIALESTYTAKTLAAVVQYSRSGFNQSPILFWNTFAGPVLEANATPEWDDRLPDEFKELINS